MLLEDGEDVLEEVETAQCPSGLAFARLAALSE
jgi:hypothetical protein